VAVDVFDHHDGIVEDQSDPGRDAAQGHEVEAHAERVEHQAGDRYGTGDHRGRDRRRAQVGDEHKQGGNGQQHPNGDTVAHAANRVLHQFGLVVVDREPHIGMGALQDGQAIAHAARDRHGVPARSA
jgi:hypothetical protein